MLLFGYPTGWSERGVFLKASSSGVSDEGSEVRWCSFRCLFSSRSKSIRHRFTEMALVRVFVLPIFHRHFLFHASVTPNAFPNPSPITSKGPIAATVQQRMQALIEDWQEKVWMVFEAGIDVEEFCSSEFEFHVLGLILKRQRNEV